MRRGPVGPVAGGIAAAAAALTVGPYLLPLPPTPDEPAEAHARPGGRFVTVDGTRTYIEEAGPPDGPAVVLLHGFGGSTFSWRDVLPALAAAGFRATAIDLLGYGLADKRLDADHSPGAQARFVGAVLDACGVGRGVLVGHSMGADVAVHLALAEPQRVAGLVLVDAATGPGFRRPGGALGPLARIVVAWPPFRRLARILIRRLATPDRVRRILRSAYLDPATVVTASVEAGYLVPQRLRDWDLALLAIIRDAARAPHGSDLADVAVPTLIVWGERDPWIPPSVGRALLAAIPGSHWAGIPASGHLPFEEQPDAFLRAVIPFLESVS